ncbi:hypothetical protein HG421_10070 [Xanthomonas campestris pv. badrii]|uniref:Uncharacterized protein n=1 Tax=Xanthomonas campestris pv. badrii TaxID=149696 RepID=A0A7Z2VEP4_XANCA|nr:hypothetical protein [Xanthomonas campestris]MCC4606000.1 hypothetical protein [Xanthomonas campestris pv. parthenii]QJD70042.1 hypothetical protein HG421_10070 [Xanthomonas campestris pv. badrii]
MQSGSTDSSGGVTVSEAQDHALFSLQRIIDCVIRDRSRLLVYLEGQGVFTIDAPDNGLYLPNDQAFAKELGCACYCSDPHPSYVEGMLGELQRIEVSADGQAAMQGDPLACRRVVEAVGYLQATIKVALINGDLILA